MLNPEHATYEQHPAPTALPRSGRRLQQNTTPLPKEAADKGPSRRPALAPAAPGAVMVDWTRVEPDGEALPRSGRRVRGMSYPGLTE